MVNRRALIAALALSTGAGAARDAPRDASRTTAPASRVAPAPDAIARLGDEETRLRRVTDVAHAPAAERVTGPNPGDLAALPDGRLVALLGGVDTLVLLDASGRELERVPTPRDPRALAIAPGPVVLVASWGAPELARWRVDDFLEPDAPLPAGDAVSIVDLAAGPDGWLFAADAASDRFLAIPLAPTGAAPRELARCAGPARVVRRDDLLALDCLLDHEVRVFAVGGDGLPAGAPATIRHDGPIWSVDAARTPSGRALVALGGVEDHPLVCDGGFQHVDSYVFAWDATPGDAGGPRRLVALDACDDGLVTVKALRLDVAADGAATIDALAFGSAGRLQVSLAADGHVLARRALPSVPGVVAAVPSPRAHGLLAASTLLDAFVRLDDDGAAPAVLPVAGPAPDPDVRLGELVFFTTLMSPYTNRVTCETCHADGYGDGRVHFTGREDIHATTKPLRGVLADRPYFSRALDRTAAGMVHSEFRVANAGSGRSPWFAVDAHVVPWLGAVPDLPAALDPFVLRRALLRFFAAFGHEPNPFALGRARFTDDERHGAELFRDRCESCHQARLFADDPDSRVPYARWESLVLSPSGPILWASDQRVKTGVEPYVHAEGARVPALRRLYRKRPYFTNGSAPTLDAVLDGARVGSDGHFAHASAAASAAGADPGAPLAVADRPDLIAFLRLL